MKNTYQLQIPKELEQYRTILEESVKPYIKVAGTKAETTLFESKFGGYPYLPINQEHPHLEIIDLKRCLVRILIGKKLLMKKIIQN